MSLTARLRDGTRITLGRTQLERAATIVTVGARTGGVGDNGIRIALMAALTESNLKMLANATAYPESTSYPNDGDGSDHDSLGLFQMRPSSGWGSVHQLMGATYQARAFFGGPTGPNRGSPRGLLDIPGWRGLNPAAAAQAVERSAHPQRYANTEPVADAIIAALAANTRHPSVSQPVDHSAGQSVGHSVGQSVGRSGTGRRLGQMPLIQARPGGPVNGRIKTANANLKYPKTTPAALRLIAAQAAPDFITLNEIHRFSARALERALPGYGAYKDPVAIAGGNPAQSINNAIMWRQDAWRMVDGGRVKIVEDDLAIFHGKQVRWDRYAIWGVFERLSDRAVIPVIATHHMTNVKTMPAQWGNPPLARRQQYGLGMDILLQLATLLGAYGPVLVGGDMNSNPGDGAFAAAPRMEAAGFSYTKDRGVMYQFFPRQVAVAAHRQVTVPSDHPANITSLEMNGIGPGAASATPHGEAGSLPAGSDSKLPESCAPCPRLAGLVPLPGSDQTAPSMAGPYDLGPVTPSLRRLVEILAPMFGIKVVGGYRPSARDPGGHPSGNAADFVVPATSTGWATGEGRQVGDALAAYAQAHASELNVDYIIWWQHIWSVERASEGWRPMESRGSSTQDHRDHVHVNVQPGPGGMQPWAVQSGDGLSASGCGPALWK
ncbi:endonuclease/exonuclease/phosphatase family protein [Nocardioides carbamazepini]|uniref:endonuclease/exonuclease/phosphatase family protein n=1 Tax=Nocardioides carbamazepini TaxID=2854259 RepID=UPI002149A6AF|nr:endonuclease/exonuclease/phosphatase family protein [Nocardioides carbamazepini]MCR1785913.1 endonuclease/exonuclease/phosphatase family protein [Nocardioides carbamazepini]